MGIPYQLKVTLEDTSPPIWRKIVVPGDLTLGDLHEVIQLAMGWENSHLHEFKIGLKFFRGNHVEVDEVEADGNDDEITLEKVLGSRRRKFTYTYDFGDSWTHVINVEKRPAKGTNTEFPRCLDGERACPPEDCGGIPGFENLLETLENPGDPDHDELKEWLDDDFAPERFDVDAVNESLQRSFSVVWLGGFIDPWHNVNNGPADADDAPVFVFWLDAGSGYVLGEASATRGEWRDSALELFEAALEDVDDGVLRVPHNIRVDDEELSKKAAALGASRGVPIELGPIPEFDEIAEELTEKLAPIMNDSEEDFVELETETIDDDLLKSFFASAADLYRAEPWTCAAGQIMRLSAPALELPDAIVVIDGERDQEFSLILLESPRDFFDFIDATGTMEPDGNLPPPTVVVRSFHYERGASIPREARRMISELGLDVANARAYPSIIIVGADGVEKPPTKLDHRRISACAVALTTLIQDHQKEFVDGTSLEIELDVPDSPDDIHLVVRSGDDHQTVTIDDDDRSGYNAMVGPNDPESWLDKSEEERVTGISEYHHRLGEPEAPENSGHVHSAIHMIVENQLAANDPPQARKALERLIAEGLDRHDGIHAIGAVVAGMIFGQVKNDRPFSQESYAKKLATLDVETWHKEYGETESDGGKTKKSSRKKQKQKGKRGKKRKR